jgi:hypothetical protein
MTAVILGVILITFRGIFELAPTNSGKRLGDSAADHKHEAPNRAQHSRFDEHDYLQKILCDHAAAVPTFEDQTSAD